MTGAARIRFDGGEVWPGVVASIVALTAITFLAAHFGVGLVLAAVLGLVGGTIAVLILYARPEWIVPLFVVAVPVEISKRLFPFLLLDKGVAGEPVSLIDFSRLVLLLGLIAFLLRVLAEGRVSVPRHRILYATVALLLLYTASAVGNGGSWTEVLRLGSNLALLYFTIVSLRTPAHVATLFRVFIWLGLATALLAVFQFATGIVFWNAVVDVTGVTRVNVFFADPNILARFFAMWIAVQLVLLDSGILPRRLLIVSVALETLGIAFTVSRGGLVLLLVAIGSLVWFGRGRMRRRLIIGVLVLAPVMVAAILSVPAVRTRIATLSMGISALGPRVALIVTGIRIFLDHPVFGAGIGTYHELALRSYAVYLPYGGHYVSNSHTAIITILAELGIVGLIALALVWGAFLRTYHRAAAEPALRPYALASYICLIVILVGSQDVGRLFEEPMLWVFAGVLAALERIPGRVWDRLGVARRAPA